jgi:hypothetical protein
VRWARDSAGAARQCLGSWARGARKKLPHGALGIRPLGLTRWDVDGLPSGDCVVGRMMRTLRRPCARGPRAKACVAPIEGRVRCGGTRVIGIGVSRESAARNGFCAPRPHFDAPGYPVSAAPAPASRLSSLSSRSPSPTPARTTSPPPPAMPAAPEPKLVGGWHDPGMAAAKVARARKAAARSGADK